ncbi:MAG: FliH/SctL family protein [Phycisphaerales bacterium]
MTESARPSKLVTSSAGAKVPYEPARLLRKEVLESRSIIEDTLKERARIEAQCRAAIEQANRKAEAIIHAAHEEGQRIRESAQTEGRIEFDRLAAGLAAEFEKLGADMAQRVVDFSFKAARSILRSEVRVQPAPVLAMLREMLLRTRMFNRIHVVLSPEDASVARVELDRLRALSAYAQDFAIKEDSELPRGSVRIETEAGAFDGGLETRLSQLAESWGVAGGGSGT